MEYSARKKKENAQSERKLEEDIQALENKPDKTVEEQYQLQNKKEDLVALRKSKVQGILVRSKARWAAEGEKVTKYFFVILKRGTTLVNKCLRLSQKMEIALKRQMKY